MQFRKVSSHPGIMDFHIRDSSVLAFLRSKRVDGADVDADVDADADVD